MHLLEDVRYGLRILTKNPGFTTVTVAILALGIGAISAIFSVVNTVVLRPLPFKDPGNLVAVWETQPSSNKTPASAANFIDWRSQAQVFEGLAAYSGQSFNLTNAGEPERIDLAIVSPEFFQLFGVAPILGRTFSEGEDQASAGRVAVISEGLWKRRFASDKAILGTDLVLNDAAFKVIGVMPGSFRFPDRADIWINPQRVVPDPPIALQGDILKMRQVHYMGVVGRLKPDVTLDQAQAEMQAVAQRLAQEYPDTNQGYGIRLVPLDEEIIGQVKPALLTFLGAVAFVLLIACSNVANLLLGRAVIRQKEFGIRLALGASRRRIIQQLLTESIMLALIGGAVGLLLAHWGIQLLLAFSPGTIPRIREVSLDASVLVITFVVSVITGIGFGLAPALQSLKQDVTGALKEGSRGSSDGPARHRLRKGLVVAEVALSLVLLIGAGLMLKSFYRLQNVELGFNPQNVLTMQISLPRSKYTDKHQITSFYDQVLKRVEMLPGVRTAGAVSKLPLNGTGVSGELVIEGRAATAGEQLLADRRIISSDYFRAMSIPVQRGRVFAQADAQGPGVVMINETAAKRFWPNEDPIGRRLSIDTASAKWLEVVGIVGDAKGADLYGDPKPEIYLPYFQSPWHNMTVVAQLDPGAPDLSPSLRSEVLAVDRNQPVYNIKTMDQIIEESISQPRFNLILIALFAAAAIILAAIGLYGVMAALVSQRTHEIGIRMALGAQPKDILRMILGQGITLVLVGVGIGLALAFALSQSISSMLFKVNTTDLITYVGVSVFLVVITLAANMIPAYRASRVSPTQAIRGE